MANAASNEAASCSDLERRNATERYAAALARQNGTPYHVDAAQRGWLRVFRGTPESRSIVCFVGSSSGGVYEGKTATRYGKRVGNIFMLADVLAGPVVQEPTGVRIVWRGLAAPRPPENAHGARGYGGTPSDPDSIDVEGSSS